MNKRACFLFSTFLFVLFSCKKKVDAPPKKTCAVTIYSYNVSDGSPAETTIVVWSDNGGFTPSSSIPDHRVVFPGGTNGLTEFTITMEHNVQYWVEVIRKGHGDYNSLLLEDSRINVWNKITKGAAEAHFNVGLDPFYSIILTASNINCTAPNDSITITSTSQDDWGAYQATGCVDKTFYNIPWTSWLNGTVMCDSNVVNLEWVTNKSGVISSFSEQYALPLSNSPTPITIEY